MEAEGSGSGGNARREKVRQRTMAEVKVWASHKTESHAPRSSARMVGAAGGRRGGGGGRGLASEGRRRGVVLRRAATCQVCARLADLGRARAANLVPVVLALAVALVPSSPPVACSHVHVALRLDERSCKGQGPRRRPPRRVRAPLVRPSRRSAPSVLPRPRSRASQLTATLRAHRVEKVPPPPCYSRARVEATLTALPHSACSTARTPSTTSSATQRPSSASRSLLAMATAPTSSSRCVRRPHSRARRTSPCGALG